MNAEALLDSNILVYAYDQTEGKKCLQARTILESAWEGKKRFAISTQNLAEFYVIVTKKIERPIPKKEAAISVQHMATSLNFTILAPDKECLIRAMNLSEQNNIPFWDAHIIAVALKHGVRTILTENIKDFKAPGLRAVNPFE